MFLNILGSMMVKGGHVVMDDPLFGLGVWCYPFHQACLSEVVCELCSPFNCSFDEFVGEKVVSPSYSSTILAPPLQACLSDDAQLRTAMGKLRVQTLRSSVALTGEEGKLEVQGP